MGLELAYDHLGVLECRLLAPCCVAAEVVLNKEGFWVFVRAVYSRDYMFALKVRRFQTITVLFSYSIHCPIDTKFTYFF